jgi:LPS O-antigen subunit length determinant protein (WzzB/FepE family)
MKMLFWVLVILLGLALAALVGAIMTYIRTLKWKRRLKTDDILRSKWEAFNKAQQECEKILLDVQLLEEMVNAFKIFLKVENAEGLLRELEMAKTELNTTRECSIDVFIKANLELDKYCEEFNIERME